MTKAVQGTLPGGPVPRPGWAAPSAGGWPVFLAPEPTPWVGRGGGGSPQPLPPAVCGAMGLPQVRAASESHFRGKMCHLPIALLLGPRYLSITRRSAAGPSGGKRLRAKAPTRPGRWRPASHPPRGAPATGGLPSGHRSTSKSPPAVLTSPSQGSQWGS